MKLEYTFTKEFRELERQRHYASHNRASALGHARREGENAKALTIAKNLIEMDMPLEKIVAATGLTREKIENIRDAD